MYVSSVQGWHHRAIDIVCFLFPLFLLFVCVFVNSLALAFLVASFLASGLSAHALGGIALHTHSSSHPLVSPVVSALAFVEHDIKLDSKKKKSLIEEQDQYVQRWHSVRWSTLCLHILTRSCPERPSLNPSSGTLNRSHSRSLDLV